MPLDPLLERLLSAAYRKGLGKLHSLSPAHMREYLTHPYLSSKISCSPYQDYHPAPFVTLRCHSPPCQEQTLPAVVYFPANAFLLNRLDAGNRYCALLAHTLNRKVIQVAHRLLPENKFPLFLGDCLRSIRWIAENALHLKINPQAIALWGESSGATIATVCAHLLQEEKTVRIQHQTLFYPMTDLVTFFPSKAFYSYGYMLDKDFLSWLDQTGFEPTQDRRDPQISPLFADRLSGLPPTTLITAEYDPLRDEGEAYARALSQEKVPVLHKRFLGMIHGFLRFYPRLTAAREAWALACQALQKL